MRYYHCCPQEYFEVQTAAGDFIPHFGSTWLAETPEQALQASQQKSNKKVILEFDLDVINVEDHSDMNVCKRLGVRYYIYRGVISKDQMTVFQGE